MIIINLPTKKYTYNFLCYVIMIFNTSFNSVSKYITLNKEAKAVAKVYLIHFSTCLKELFKYTILQKFRKACS